MRINILARRKRAVPRLVRVAAILSAAALLAHLAASHLPTPKGGPGTFSEISWVYAQYLAYVLFLAAIGVWVLWGVVRVIRWAAGFQGF